MFPYVSLLSGDPKKSSFTAGLDSDYLPFSSAVPPLFATAGQAGNKSLSKQSLLAIYYVHVYSHIRYGIICWGNYPKSLKIFKLQKWVIRSIHGARTIDSCKPLFQKYNLLTLPSIYIIECALFVKQNSSLFTRNNFFHKYETRKKN